MGAWGHGSFQNDAAGDWEDDFAARGVEAVASTLKAVTGLPEDEDLAQTTASQAIAAAEVVAAARDGDTSRLPDELVARAFAVHQNAIAAASLHQQARRAVDRVLRQSELKELWEDSEDFQKWLTVVNALDARLR